MKLDVTFEKNGYMADTAATLAVEPVTDQARRLITCAERAFQQAMPVARAFHRVNEIGKAIENEVRRSGFSVIRQLGGHGIGRTIHEPPSVPNFNDPSARQLLTPGLVLAVSPSSPLVRAARALRKTVGPSAPPTAAWPRTEHTIVITDRAPLFLTAAWYVFERENAPDG